MLNIVTGGAGLIGSHLIDKLISANEKVVCLDNFLTGNLANIKHDPDEVENKDINLFKFK